MKIFFTADMNEEQIKKIIALFMGELTFLVSWFHLDITNEVIHFFAVCAMVFLSGYLSVMGKDAWTWTKTKINKWRK